ncbi:glutathione S-transferase [Alcanivorax xiamenensis]|uniref:Glutathione S-transferase n=1 Tax=Alcanivorax xiamenensis TaxID=1177156 RepID=A0ABQ6YCC7_9GAMM|nr:MULTISPECIES: glutathione S-transferase family protein [Alcanivorax]KAF0807785.1 glutathione S-transferase [Alcanivorax xiamenensis]
MITLYHCHNARSFRCLWALEALELPYQLNMMPFPPRVECPDYLQQNPLGTIPLLVDGDTRMTESSGIVHYLVSRYGPDSSLALSADHPEYGAWINGLYFGEATLTFPQTLVLRYTQLEPEERRLPRVAEDYTRWFLSRLKGVERALSDRDWLCAGRFTAADISVAYALLLAQRLDLSQYFPPRVSAYWQRAQQEPAYLRAQRSQDRHQPSSAAVNPLV